MRRSAAANAGRAPSRGTAATSVRRRPAPWPTRSHADRGDGARAPRRARDRRKRPRSRPARGPSRRRRVRLTARSPIGERRAQERRAGCETCAAQVVGPRHAALVLGLHLEWKNAAIGGRDHEVTVMWCQCSWRRHSAGADALPAPDRDPTGSARRRGSWPGVAATDDVAELARRTLPVEVPVGFLESRRERRLIVTLWFRRQRVEAIERVDEHAGT